jgi:hypothetical protein
MSSQLKVRMKINYQYSLGKFYVQLYVFAVVAYLTSSRPSMGPTQSPTQWVAGVISPVAKRQEREADHPSPTGAEAKKKWIYTSAPPKPSWRSA